MKKSLLMLAAFIGCAAFALPEADAQISVGIGVPGVSVYSGYGYRGYGYGYPAYSGYNGYVAPYSGYVAPAVVAPAYRRPAAYYGYGAGYGYRPAYVPRYGAYGYRRW